MLHRTINENRAAIERAIHERALGRRPSCAAGELLGGELLLFVSQLSDLLFLKHADPGSTNAEKYREIAATGGSHGARLRHWDRPAVDAIDDYSELGRLFIELMERTGAKFTSEDYETMTSCIDAAMTAALNSHARLGAPTERGGAVVRGGSASPERAAPVRAVPRCGRIGLPAAGANRTALRPR